MGLCSIFNIELLTEIQTVHCGFRIILFFNNIIIILYNIVCKIILFISSLIWHFLKLCLPDTFSTTMTQADKWTDDKASPQLYCYNEPYSEKGRDGRGFAGTGGHVKWSLTGLDEGRHRHWVRGSEVLLMVAERSHSLCTLWENRTFLSPWDSTFAPAHILKPWPPIWSSLEVRPMGLLKETGPKWSDHRWGYSSKIKEEARMPFLPSEDAGTTSSLPGRMPFL